MLAVTDFPLLKLCDPCSRLFTDYADESGSSKESIQFSMWYKSEGHRYRRIRRDLESAAIFGCVFCKGITSHDHKYKAGDAVDTSEVRFEESRPDWWPPLDEELSLAIRYNWVDNVMFFRSHGGVDWSGGDLGFSMYTIPDDPSATKVHAQAVLTDLGSPESFADARGWMEDCLNNHNGCCTPHMPTDLPTRLVQVSPLGEPESARLRETPGQKGHYCALSYCWGGDQVHKTLWKRYDAYKENVPYSALPKTITDAFQVTRNMGLQYIWIDSLCIIQDKEEDKEVEMSKMMRIYQNAQFTISVASASSVTQGFLHTNLDSEKVEAFYHPLRVDEETFGAVLISKSSSSSFACVGAHQQPLNTRGWTLQEALITPRILFFTDLHMVWKCASGFQPDFHANSRASREPSESPWSQWSRLCGYSFASLQQLQEAPEIPKTGESFNMYSGAYSAWHLILGEYTKRSLSFESDRLPAISAIAQVFASSFKSRYYAGLWENFLVYDLMWENTSWHFEVDKVIKYKTCPSWSWASINGEHQYDGGNEVYAGAGVFTCSTTLVTAKNPFGAVTGGELVIHGHLNTVWLEIASSKLLSNQGSIIPDTEFLSDGRFGEWHLIPDCADRIEIFCLVLSEKPWHMLHYQCESGSYCRLGDGECKDDTSWKCTMMALVKSKRQEGCYERIGLAKAGRDYGPYWWRNCDQVTVKVV